MISILIKKYSKTKNISLLFLIVGFSNYLIIFILQAVFGLSINMEINYFHIFNFLFYIGSAFVLIFFIDILIEKKEYKIILSLATIGLNIFIALISLFSEMYVINRDWLFNLYYLDGDPNLSILVTILYFIIASIIFIIYFRKITILTDLEFKKTLWFGIGNLVWVVGSLVCNLLYIVLFSQIFFIIGHSIITYVNLI